VEETGSINGNVALFYSWIRGDTWREVMPWVEVVWIGHCKAGSSEWVGGL
jgi:hypothetical protein